MSPTSFSINFFPHPFMEMEGNNIEDVSSFFLIEATGDSEADSMPLSTDTDNCTVYNSRVINDAESCSDDTADSMSVCEINGGDFLIEDEDGDRDGHGDDDDDDDGEESSYGYDYGTSVEFRKSDANSIDSTKEFEMMNEMEKNKLFWETCLAS